MLAAVEDSPEVEVDSVAAAMDSVVVVPEQAIEALEDQVRFSKCDSLFLYTIDRLAPSSSCLFQM